MRFALAILLCCAGLARAETSAWTIDGRWVTIGGQGIVIEAAPQYSFPRQADTIMRYTMTTTNADGNIPDESAIGTNTLVLDVGGSRPTWTNFDGHPCLYFDGTDGASAGDQDIFTMTNGMGGDTSFTISAWVYLETTDSNTRTFAGKWDIGGQCEYHFPTRNGALYGTVYSSTDNWTRRNSTNDTITTGVWTMVTWTYDGSEVAAGNRLYRNLDRVDSTSVTYGTYTGMTNTTLELSFGRDSSFLIGFLDEITIWRTRELTAHEITNLYYSSTH